MIATNNSLYNYIKKCLIEFSFEKELSRAEVKNRFNNGVFKLPAEKDKIVAFVRFNDKNALPFKVNSFLKDKKIGSILFVCVDKAYKDCGYDEVMSRVARRYLVKRGCKKVIITATKDINFYKKLLGYE